MTEMWLWIAVAVPLALADAILLVQGIRGATRRTAVAPARPVHRPESQMYAPPSGTWVV